MNIVELEQIRDDVIIKVDFDDREFEFIDETFDDFVISVSFVGRYVCLVVGNSGSVDGRCAGGFDQIDDGREDDDLLFVDMNSERVSGDAEDRVYKRVFLARYCT